MNQSSEVLLKLLRIALGNESDCSLPSCVNWREVIDLSFEQGVAAIAVDGLQRIYDRLEVSGERLACLEDLDSPELEDLKYEWFGEVMNCEQDYGNYEAAIERLACLYNGVGLMMMVLKGYGLSRNYPVPSHRPTGDIDIFLTEGSRGSNGSRVQEAWKRGDEAVTKEWGVEVDYANPHHSTFCVDGYLVENHISFLNNYSHKDNEDVERKLVSMVEGCKNRYRVGKGTIILPSVQFNALYLLRHSSSHFTTEKLSLRQLLDWALFVDKYSHEIDWTQLWMDAKEANMHRFLACLNRMCVEYLGFDEGKFPFAAEAKDLHKRVMEDILHPEFDEEIPPRSRLLRYSIAKTRRLWTNRWKYAMVYNEPLWKTFWNLALNRAKNG